MDRIAAGQAFLDTFTNVFTMLEHMVSMRESMERMEVYMLCMLVMCAIAFIGVSSNNNNYI
jgi:hypothetical protein